MFKKAATGNMTTLPLLRTVTGALLGHMLTLDYQVHIMFHIFGHVTKNLCADGY